MEAWDKEVIMRGQPHMAPINETPRKPMAILFDKEYTWPPLKETA